MPAVGWGSRLPAARVSNFATVALFVAASLWTVLVLRVPSLRFLILLPRARPALEAAGLVVATLVSVLAYIRFSLTGSRSLLLIAVAFVVLSANQLVFGVILPPDLVGAEPAVYFWTAGRLLVGILLLAAAVGARSSTEAPRRPLAEFLLRVVVATLALAAVESVLWVLRDRLPLMSIFPTPVDPGQLTSALPGLTAAAVVLGAGGTALFLAAAVAFLRSSTNQPILSMFGPALVVAAFSHIHYMLVPTVFTDWVSTGDILRLTFSATLLVVLVWDVRATHLAERARSLALAEAYAAERGRVQELEDLERAKAELFGIVTHELVHPAAALRGMVLILSRRGNQLDQEIHRELLDRIERETVRLTDLAEEASAATQRGATNLALHPTPHRVDRLVSEAVETAPVSQDRLIVRVDPDAAESVVEADPARMLQVFRNLLSNALKFSEPDTPVEIDVQLEEGEISFTVRDRGPGIAASDLPRLFRPFSRVSDPESTRHPGTGLGLYVSRQIVEAHGGGITVDSEVGRGSSFRFTLPRAVRGRARIDE